MKNQTYLFYDIETTGLSKTFDQVLQFAAIRTDLNFNEIERTEIKLRLNPDLIPSPGALITHRMKLSDCFAGEAERAAIKKIHELFNTPNTISLGYNTLGFDDEFLRFSFYRNLLPAYTHQYANGCQRMDVYPIAVLYYVFAPETLNWPKLNDKISLKLELLNQANQLTTGRAHDAIVDVEATLALAKRFKENQKVWEYATGFFDKTIEQQRFQKLPSAYTDYDARIKEALLISGKLGSDNYFQAPVLYLGPHLHYKNQQLWLRLDQPDLQQFDGKNIDKSSWVFRKRAAEPPFLLPPEPRLLKYLTDERRAIVESNKAWLKDHPNHWKKLCDYYQSFKYPDVPDIDLDAALYPRGFPSDSEMRLWSEFHRAPLDEKFNVSERFGDPLNQELAIRILGREDHTALPEAAQQIFQQYLSQLHIPGALLDYQNKPKLTPQNALEEIALLRKNALDAEQITLLQELETWLKEKWHDLSL